GDSVKILLRRLGLKLLLSQNVQPPMATVPSTFGHVNPASTLTFCTRRAPNLLCRKCRYVWYLRPAFCQLETSLSLPDAARSSDNNAASSGIISKLTIFPSLRRVDFGTGIRKRQPARI